MEKQAKLVEIEKFKAPENGECFYYTVNDGVRLRIAIWGKNSKMGTIILQSGRTEFIENFCLKPNRS